MHRYREQTREATVKTCKKHRLMFHNYQETPFILDIARCLENVTIKLAVERNAG
jgi:hypothetical protein